MAQSPIQAAIQQICQEKDISEESVLSTIELALAAAFRKDFGNKMQNIVTEFDPKTGQVKVFDVKTVVEDVPEEEESTEEIKDEAEENKEAFVSPDDEEEIKKFNPRTEIQLTEAKEIKKTYKLGDVIRTELEVPGEFGRMAAQTAKQVIIQKIREQERQNIYEEYKEFEGQVINGTVQRREGRNVLVDLGKTTAIMPPDEQVMRERYNIGNRMKFYLKIVDQTTRGPQLIVSRVSTEIVRKIFETEIPEIANGVVEIKSIAREAGNRSKVAIFTEDENIDPIGSCVGQRGARIQTIISELNNEKIDIILWDEDAVKFITNALSPAKVVAVELQDKVKETESGDSVPVALVTVKEDQLSLAIGKGGQNVRLASKLTGWKIDIISDTGKKPEELEAEKAEEESKEEVEEKTEEAETEEKAKKPNKKVTKKKVSKKEEEAKEE